MNKKDINNCIGKTNSLITISNNITKKLIHYIIIKRFTDIQMIY